MFYVAGLNTAVVVPIALFAAAYVISRIRWQRRTRGRPLPPGPKSLPFLGNIAHMQRPEPWRAHRDLCTTYGDVVYVPVLGQDIVLLGSADAVSDLLDKRSAVTSDREQSALIPLSGQDFNIAFMPYGHVWRQHRRVFAEQFSVSAASEEHQQIQQNYAQLFLRKLLNEPEELREHIRYTFSASIMKTVFGLEVAEKRDENVTLMERVLEGVQAFTPGRSRRVKQGPFVGNILLELEGTDKEKYLEMQEIARNVAVTAFEDARQTYTTLQFFFLAMWLYPDVQHKAQRELDTVVGPHRLPIHADQAALPYVTAIVKEALRWQNALPNGVPHHTSEDLEYRGFFIPQGTALIPLTWACLHDPEVYAEPERFIPSDTSVRDPSDFAFGYGRRKCPGMAFAESSLFINIAMALHTFDITPPLDEHGDVVTIEPKPVGSVLLYPEECRCSLKPRSEQAERLVFGSYVGTSGDK
ncbi:cytochrome P450 [Daedaleopsis nitida]|nr:cytochrome P450 [Daedaleopsis nitida]